MNTLTPETEGNRDRVITIIRPANDSLDGRANGLLENIVDRIGDNPVVLTLDSLAMTEDDEDINAEMSMQMTVLSSLELPLIDVYLLPVYIREKSKKLEDDDNILDYMDKSYNFWKEKRLAENNLGNKMNSNVQEGIRLQKLYKVSPKIRSRELIIEYLSDNSSPGDFNFNFEYVDTNKLSETVRLRESLQYLIINREKSKMGGAFITEKVIDDYKELVLKFALDRAKRVLDISKVYSGLFTNSKSEVLMLLGRGLDTEVMEFLNKNQINTDYLNMETSDRLVSLEESEGFDIGMIPVEKLIHEITTQILDKFDTNSDSSALDSIDLSKVYQEFRIGREVDVFRNTLIEDLLFRVIRSRGELMNACCHTFGIEFYEEFSDLTNIGNIAARRVLDYIKETGKVDLFCGGNEYRGQSIKTFVIDVLNEINGHGEMTSMGKDNGPRKSKKKNKKRK